MFGLCCSQLGYAFIEHLEDEGVWIAEDFEILTEIIFILLEMIYTIDSLDISCLLLGKSLDEFGAYGGHCDTARAG